MNFQGNFTKNNDTDIRLIKELVLQLTPEHWTGDTTRQRRYERIDICRRSAWYMTWIFDTSIRRCVASHAYQYHGPDRVLAPFSGSLH